MSIPNQKQLDYFAGLTGGKHRGSGVAHSPELWDKRAATWEAELLEGGSRAQRSVKRVEETARYLREQGALGESTRLIDIGCGLGRFTAGFGKIAADSLGVDFSAEMTRRGAEYAARLGVKNARFETCDFDNVDIDERGWRNAFDLVFASITPAVTGPDGWKRMIDMSRAWCYMSTYVRSSVPLEAKLGRELYGLPEMPSRDGRGFYAMLNTLWLWGYYPRVTYFRECADERRLPDRTLAVKLDERFNGTATEAETERILDYLRSIAGPDGTFHYFGEWIYGWLLWDVRHCDVRDYE